MSYAKIAKPDNKGYLQREQDNYLLLETGGKIIINSGYSKVIKPTGNYSKIAKPTGNYSKIAKPTGNYSKIAKPTGNYSKIAKPTIP